MKDKQFNPLDPFNGAANDCRPTGVNKRTVDDVYIDVQKVKKLYRKIAKLEYKAGFLEFRNGFVEAAGKHLTRAIELDPTIKHKYKFNGETLVVADQKQAEKIFADKDIRVNGIFDSSNMKPVTKEDVVGPEKPLVRVKSKFQKDIEAAFDLIDKKIEAEANTYLGKVNDFKAGVGIKSSEPVTSPTEVSPLNSSRPNDVPKKDFSDIKVPEYSELFSHSLKSADNEDLLYVTLEVMLDEIEEMLKTFSKPKVSKDFNAPANKEATKKQVDGIKKILTADEHEATKKQIDGIKKILTADEHEHVYQRHDQKHAKS
jgi:hypothetical protein